MSDYHDSNGNGVPDAFENRLPISEILNLPEDVYYSPSTVIVEIEKTPRSPKKGEWYFTGSGKLEIATFDFSVTGTFKTNVIVRFLSGDPSKGDQNAPTN